MSEDAKRLIDEIEKYMQVSMKTDYVLTYEEQRKIEDSIRALNIHLNMLIDYELKKEGVKKDENE